MNETAEYSSTVLMSGLLHEGGAPSRVPAIMGPPKQIACYSVNPTGVKFNTSSLRYFVTPPLGANLGEGCFSFMHRYRNVMHEPQRLDNVLLACLHGDAKECLLQADVVVRRGLLVKIMLRTKVQLNVSLIDGVLYIEEWASKPRQQYYTTNFAGYAFESLCTSSSPFSLESEEPTMVRSGVDPEVQWLSVISRRLGDLNIVLAGEVDCVKGRYTGQPDTFLELKTKKIVDPDKNLIAWYKKSYFQSHLLGVSELLIGHHSNNILRRTELLHVADIPSKIAETGPPWNRRTWNHQAALDQGYATLTAIIQSCSEQMVQRSGVDRVWRVEVGAVTKIQELTVQEVNNLASTNDPVKRIGIVPSRVIDELRMMSTET